MSPEPREPAQQAARPGIASVANGIEARLLAEAVRIHEGAGGPAVDSTAAEAAARQAGGTLEQRLLTRARELDRTLDMTGALGHVQGALRLAIAGLLLAAALAGIATAQTVMGAVMGGRGAGGGTMVNFFVVLFAALGPATAALLFWLAFAMMGVARSAGLLGRVAADLAARLVRLTHRDAIHAAALRAVGGIMGAGSYGRWTLGAVSHGAWLAFLAALLAMVLFLLSTRSYVFVWETTILSADTYVPLTRWLAALPTLLGFPAPGTEDIRASQLAIGGTQAALARDAWAGLLVGCIVVYGIVPRLALLVLCLALRARAGRRFRLDTARPGYARLAPRLMPAAEGLGFADSEDGTTPRRAPARHDATQGRVEADPRGPVAVLGLEVDVPAAGWPPALAAGAMLDLGRAQGRQDIRRALDELRRAAPAPRLLVLVCALTTTPDRGLLAQVDAVLAASAIPLVLLLTGGQRLRARSSGESLAARLADWRALADAAGIAADRIVELDLDNLTDVSRAKLGAIAGGPGVAKEARARPEADRLGRAFAVIRAEQAEWTASPELAAQAELHRSIARLYQGEDGWQKLFDPRGIGEAELVSRLKSGSDRLIAALPGRLALDPRWLTAGALAGALGCVAVATLAAPVVITGLPLWAGLGAALAAAMGGALRPRGVSDEPRPDSTDAVRAAALFALVLDAQGHDEAAITRLIDAAIGDEEPALRTAAEVAAWLDRVRQRYAEAAAGEAAR